MSETVARQGFSVVHQQGIDIRFYDPALRYQYGIDAPGRGDEADAVWYEIMNSPAGLRAQAVNQLSKSREEETYSGSTDFKIGGHVPGQYAIIRHFGRQQGLTTDDILKYSIAACVPDLGKGVKAHVTDMLVEGMGGKEEFHERRVHQIIDFGGLGLIFDKHNIGNLFGPNGKPTIKLPPWVERDSPGLCSDRLQYVNGEISIMFPDNEAIRDAIRLSNFVITDDGELAFKDVDQARVWAKAANLLSSEHWNEPTNRLIELLSLEAIKRTISKRYLAGIEWFDNGFVGRPEDYTFLTDRDFDEALEREATNKTPDIFMNAIYSLIQSIAHRERQRFTRHKRPVYEEYINDPDAREYPNALINPHLAAFGIPPAQVEILPNPEDVAGFDVQDAPLRTTDNRTIGKLKQLKPRHFDPLVITPRGPRPLSEIDRNFAAAMADHWRALTYVGAVALHANPESRAALDQGTQENRRYMEDSKQYPGLSPDQIRRIIQSSAERAKARAMERGRWVELAA